MKIQILGSGCPKCKALADCTIQAASALEIPYELEKVTDYQSIVSFGVMTTPALVVDGKVLSAGKTLTTDEIKSLLEAL